MKKKILSLFLVGALALGMLAGCGSEEQQSEQNNDSSEEKQQSGTEVSDVDSEYPEYLNLDSAFPIIKDEYKGTIKLKVAIVQKEYGGEWDDLWISQYFRDKYNIEFEVESIMESALDDKKSLMFNSGELPDIMINMALTTNEIYQYGQEEGLLLACDEYINETLTPSIAKYFENDEIRNACTTPDSHVYTLPRVTSEKYAAVNAYRMSINTAWLEELGLEMPRTLDEFTETLYTIKESDISGVGSENLYPLGGGIGNYSPVPYLLNAFGYVTTDQYGIGASYRDGEVVIPCYDMDTYKNFLELMHQYYVDGIIAEDFFTMDTTKATAMVGAGNNATIAAAPYTLGIDNYTDYESLYPLTSDWQDEMEWPSASYYKVGNFCISAETEYPELCMRIADMYYNSDTDDCRALWVGPGMNNEYNYGYVNAVYDPETNNIASDASLLPEGVSSVSQYYHMYLVGFQAQFGAIETDEAIANHYLWINEGLTEEDAERGSVQDLTLGDPHWRHYALERQAPYATAQFPGIYYLSTEDVSRISDLETIIQPYAKEQIALFITGKRDLSETDAFVEELKGMGMDELLELYKEIEVTVNGN